MSSLPQEIPFLGDNVLLITSFLSEKKYKLTLYKKWNNFYQCMPNRVKSVDMVLVDRYGRSIQATIPRIYMCLFEAMMVEGNVYVLSKFDLKYNSGYDLATYHKYLIEFNMDTEVVLSWSDTIASFGTSLIGSDNVLALTENFKYLIDVIGVMTSIRINNDFYPNGTFSTSITLKLTDDKNTFEVQVLGGLVSELCSMLENLPLGLPVIAIKFGKVERYEGRIVLQTVEGVSKLYVNPEFNEAIMFKSGLILALNQIRSMLGVCAYDKSVGFNFNAVYSFRTIQRMKEEPELGVFMVSARIMDMIELHPWWYPVCACGVIIETYIGSHFCHTCHSTDFVNVPKYRVKMVIEDDSGASLLESYDHVLLPISYVDPVVGMLPENYFPHAFDPVMGKSIVMIVEKRMHVPEGVDGILELRCVSDDPDVMAYYVSKGLCSVQSKEVPVLLDDQGNLMSPKVYNSPFTTTDDLLELYLGEINTRTVPVNDAESSSTAAERNTMVGGC